MFLDDGATRGTDHRIRGESPMTREPTSHVRYPSPYQADDRSTADAFSESLSVQARIIKQDAAALATSMQESAQLFSRYVTEQVEQRPYTTLGVAAGVGYLLGGGLANRVTGAALGTAYKLALALAARELSTRLDIPGMAAESNPNRRLH